MTTPDNIEQPTYDDILGITFKLVQATDYYVHDDEFNVWKDKTDDTDYMRNLVNNGEDVKIVGIVQPREDATATKMCIRDRHRGEPAWPFLPAGQR